MRIRENSGSALKLELGVITRGLVREDTLRYIALGDSNVFFF